MIFDLSEAEEKLQYRFRNADLLRRAFIHSSYANEHPGEASNEVFEFFGDAVLGFVVKEHLCKRFPEKNEGELTQMVQKIVSTEPLARAVLRIGLQEHLMLGAGEGKHREHHPICENLFEASVAAIYWDGGLAPAQKYVLRMLAPEIRAASGEGNAEAREAKVPVSLPGNRKTPDKSGSSVPAKSGPADKTPREMAVNRQKTRTSGLKAGNGSGTSERIRTADRKEKSPRKKNSAETGGSGRVRESDSATPKDPKSALSEKLQKMGRTHDYVMVSRQGPDHEPNFVMKVMVDGREVAKGSGTSKKRAEQMAAERALKKIR